MTRTKLKNHFNATDRTIYRWLQTIDSDKELKKELGLNGSFSFRPSDELPESVVSYLFKEKSSQIKENRPKNEFIDDSDQSNDQEPAESTEKAAEDPVDEDPEEFLRADYMELLTKLGNFKNLNIDLASKVEHLSKLVEQLTSENSRLSDKVDKHESGKIKIDPLTLVMSLILITADSFSAGYVTSKVFENNVPAVVFFSAIGFAVAFSSVKNAVSFSGWSSDRWLWWFGIVQFTLHASAFQLFMGWSLIIGKATICLMIPIATIGLALTLKAKYNVEK